MSAASRRDLLHLYRRLLRGCQTYPSKNRDRIYQSVREDFRENMGLDPESNKARQQVHVAQRGLGQLHQFDHRSSASFAVNLEQNPFPKPDDYVDRNTERVEKMVTSNPESEKIQ
jgi:Complex 1 protein (LYR family)